MSLTLCSHCCFIYPFYTSVASNPRFLRTLKSPKFWRVRQTQNKNQKAYAELVSAFENAFKLNNRGDIVDASKIKTSTDKTIFWRSNYHFDSDANNSTTNLNPQNLVITTDP